MTLQDFKYLLTAFTETKKMSFFIRTYGCQMNERDSEKMAGLLIQTGFEPAPSQEEADLMIYNTCCVRETAETKVLGHLSRLKRLKDERLKAARPKAAHPQKPFILAVGGCMPQQPEMARLLEEKHKYIDIVFGTGNRHRLPEFLWRVLERGERVVDISDGDTSDLEIASPVTTREFPHKAGVNIMYGCDNYCSYCIVPYVRGHERSRPAADVLAEIRALAEDGIREVMLLGQNVNSYAGRAKTLTSFPGLLRQVNEIPGLARIRFMTSHPKDFSDELIAAIRDCEKVCKHVHLPLQAGSTRILADMNRKYTKEDYLALTARLQTAIPQIALTTDIIVGYPGETDADFEDTLDIVRRVRFAGAFTFIYSKRGGTPAAARTDLVPRKAANERFDRLTAELYPIMTAKNEEKIGRTFDVMVEETNPAAAGKKMPQSTEPDFPAFTCKGRTDDHTLVHFPAEKPPPPGEIIPVRITSAKTFYVSGEIV